MVPYKFMAKMHTLDNGTALSTSSPNNEDQTLIRHSANKKPFKVEIVAMQLFIRACTPCQYR